MLSVQLINSFEKLWALGPEWRALERACSADLPFQTWEWATSWWSHLHENRTAVRDALRVCVVRDGSGRAVGIAPLMLTERPSFGPLRVRILQFIGADPNITELRLMLSDPALERDCHRAVMQHLRSLADDWDWVTWEGLRPESEPEADNAIVDRPFESLVSAADKSAFVLDLESTWAEFKKGLGRNIKQSLRHCYNSLERDGLTPRLEVLSAPVEIGSALGDFFRLHEARARAEDTVKHSDLFVSVRAQEFLVEVCQRLASRNAARVFRLWLGDTLVATRVGFSIGDTLYLYYSGWDPAYARYGVMTTLVAEVIQYAIANGFGHVNLSTGTHVSKTRWGAREVRYTTGAQVSPHLNSRALHFMYASAQRARTSRVARVLTPGCLVRFSDPGRGPTLGTRVLDFSQRAGPHRLAAIATGVATTLAVDTLDGVLHLAPIMVG